MFVLNVITRVKRHLKNIGRLAKPSEVAAIHATVLSILIGVFSAYFLYVHGEVRGKQIDAMNKAEEINKIPFVRSAYLPHNKDIFMADGAGDVERLKEDLMELSQLTFRPGGATIINKKHTIIPEDPAERAERILQIMNVVSHRYPFPKAIAESSQFRPEPILFTDITKLRQWLRDLGEVLRFLIPVTHHIPIMSPGQINPYLDSLAIREKEYINELKTDPFLQIAGEKAPYFLVNNFINGMYQADDIYHSTTNALNKADNLQANSISKPIFLIVLFSGFGVFLIAVILPLTLPSLNAFFYIYLPLVYYASMFCMIVAKVLQL